MLRARTIVGERVRTNGMDSVYDLSGMNRGSGITAEDTQHLTSHVPFFERFEGKTEPYALKHMGADPAKHSALILNRVSAANFVAASRALRYFASMVINSGGPAIRVDMNGPALMALSPPRRRPLKRFTPEFPETLPSVPNERLALELAGTGVPHKSFSIHSLPANAFTLGGTFVSTTAAPGVAAPPRAGRFSTASAGARSAVPSFATT